MQGEWQGRRVRMRGPAIAPNAIEESKERTGGLRQRPSGARGPYRGALSSPTHRQRGVCILVAAQIGSVRRNGPK